MLDQRLERWCANTQVKRRSSCVQQTQAAVMAFNYTSDLASKGGGAHMLRFSDADADPTLHSFLFFSQFLWCKSSLNNFFTDHYS